jgi:hypothetical protein
MHNHFCLNNINLRNNRFHTDLKRTHEFFYKFVMIKKQKRQTTSKVACWASQQKALLALETSSLHSLGIGSSAMPMAEMLTSK